MPTCELDPYRSLPASTRPRSITYNALTAAVVEAVVMAVKMNRFKLQHVK